MTQSEMEFQIRGRTIALTAQIEASIANIMLISNIANHRNDLVKLKDFNIDCKVKKARHLLREFHPEIYKVANPILKRYRKISKFRNQIAHCLFEWNIPESKSFGIWDIQEDNTDGDYFHLVKYSFDEAREQVEKLEQLVDDLAGVNEMVMKAGGYAALFTALQDANPRKKK